MKRVRRKYDINRAGDRSELLHLSKIAADEFKSVRTVGDVVEAVYRLVQPAA